MELFIVFGCVVLMLAGFAASAASAKEDPERTCTRNLVSPHRFPSALDDLSSTAFSSPDREGLSSPPFSQGEGLTLNPANGLPMMGGIGGLDVAGNPYGFDSTHDFAASSLHDSFSSSCDGFSSSDFGGCGGFTSSDFGSGGFSEW